MEATVDAVRGLRFPSLCWLLRSILVVVKVDLEKAHNSDPLKVQVQVHPDKLNSPLSSSRHRRHLVDYRSSLGLPVHRIIVQDLILNHRLTQLDNAFLQDSEPGRQKSYSRDW